MVSEVAENAKKERDLSVDMHDEEWKRQRIMSTGRSGDGARTTGSDGYTSVSVSSNPGSESSSGSGRGGSGNGADALGADAGADEGGGDSGWSFPGTGFINTR